MSLQDRIQEAITEALGSKAVFTSASVATGGSINNSSIVPLMNGEQVFVKTNSGSSCPGMFASEYEALLLLAAPEVIHVPRPIAFGEDFLVTEAFIEGARKPDWQEEMGRQLAHLHRKTQAERFGFEHDNYLGTTQQPNEWSNNWVTFWREQRLGWQLHLYERKTRPDDPLLAMGDRLLAKLDSLLAGIEGEPPVLLHGDLWAGNASANEEGEPVIFDPASYYGHREAEIGMMRMFGGFGSRCEAAYAEVWPLPPGSEERIALYKLYHELNHLNLFGSSYYQQCLTTMEQLL